MKWLHQHVSEFLVSPDREHSFRWLGDYSMGQTLQTLNVLGWSLKLEEFSSLRRYRASFERAGKVRLAAFRIGYRACTATVCSEGRGGDCLGALAFLSDRLRARGARDEIGTGPVERGAEFSVAGSAPLCLVRFFRRKSPAAVTA